MEKSEAVCAKEALELLNCAASSSFDQEKCVNLLTSLRKCILDKKVKKFLLAGEEQGKPDHITSAVDNWCPYFYHCVQYVHPYKFLKPEKGVHVKF